MYDSNSFDFRMIFQLATEIVFFCTGILLLLPLLIELFIAWYSGVQLQSDQPLWRLVLGLAVYYILILLAVLVVGWSLLMQFLRG